MNKKDIAVVGMSCKFHGCANIDEFWKNLREGKELLRFFTAAELIELNIDFPDDPDYVGVQSAIDNKASFDYLFFGYTEDEAASMDPQIRIFHEYAWKALEDAGCKPYTYSGKIGIFAGASENTNWIAHTLATGPASDLDPFLRSQLANRNFLSTLVSYKLNLKGPAYFVDTACSTSLAAIHMACRSLLMKECSAAIAGAVRVDTTGTIGYKYRPGAISSKDGHCRTFDKDSSGTVSGEGIGVVVLKRLEDALADGDHIYAVIKSSAANNDGNRKVGYTAPSATGQAECILLAHKIAGVDPTSISYIEAHGTATRLGDPIEIEALNNVFGNNGEKYCAIGSVKSNAGHLDTAAGVTGFIKTVLSLYHKEMPPSLHFKSPNPEINFHSGPFYVNTTLKEWEKKEGDLRRAGVSSFGIGGTNVHLVLEEADFPAADPKPVSHYLLPFSAKSKGALDRNIEEFKLFMAEEKETPTNLAYTLQTRRSHFKHRQFAVGKTHADIVDDLKNKNNDGQDVGSKPAIVFMFSGQGAQYRNMARGLYEKDVFFRQLMDEGLDELERLTLENYREIIYKAATPLTEDRITNTLYVQPLLFVFEYAMARLLMHWGITPDYMIGHSIGEITAACISGVFSFREGLSLVVHRATLMSSMPEGSMLSIRRPASSINPLLVKDTYLAAVNAPDFCVVSGTYEGIERFLKELEQQDIPTTKLKTSHAFHSAMMEPVMDEFGQRLDAISFSKPQIPFISNVTGKIADERVLSPFYWSSQMRETVLFQEGVIELMKHGKMLFLELGPGNTLTTFCRQINDAFPSGNSILNMIRHPLEEMDDYQLIVRRMGEIWRNGVDIHWENFQDLSAGRNISLPAYSFDTTDLPAIVHPFESIKELLLKETNSGKNKNIADWFYFPGWKRTSRVTNLTGLRQNNYLLFSDQGPVAEQLKHLLISQGNTVVEVLRGEEFVIRNQYGYIMDQFREADYLRLIDYLTALDFYPDRILYRWSSPENDRSARDEQPDRLNSDFYSLLLVCKALKIHEGSRERKLFFITDGLQQVLEKPLNTMAGSFTALGLLKVLSQENPHLFCCNIDVLADQNVHESVMNIYHELTGDNIDPVVAFRQSYRWIESFEQVHLDKNEKDILLKKEGVYIITGGAGNLGICLAEYMLRKYQANVIVIGRSELPAEEDWEKLLYEGNLKKNAISRIEDLKRLRNLPGNIIYKSADISIQEDLNRLISGIEQQYGRIDGVVHAAGNIDPANFRTTDLLNKDHINAHFDPKIKGIINLYEIFKDKEPDFVWVTSSISAVLGGLTYSAYAASNIFMDYFITTNGLSQKRWISVDLDGLAVRSTSPDSAGITGPEFIEVFERSFRILDKGVVVVSTSELKDRLTRNILKSPSSFNAVANEIKTVPAPERKIRRRIVNTDMAASETEKALAHIWQDFFGTEEIGLDDDFFELGGDSLRAMTLSRRIHKEFNVELSIEVFFKQTTIRLLSKEIEIILGIQKLNVVENSNDSVSELII